MHTKRVSNKLDSINGWPSEVCDSSGLHSEVFGKPGKVACLPRAWEEHEACRIRLGTVPECRIVRPFNV